MRRIMQPGVEASIRQGHTPRLKFLCYKNGASNAHSRTRYSSYDLTADLISNPKYSQKVTPGDTLIAGGVVYSTITCDYLSFSNNSFNVYSPTSEAETIKGKYVYRAVLEFDYYDEEEGYDNTDTFYLGYFFLVAARKDAFVSMYHLEFADEMYIMDYCVKTWELGATFRTNALMTLNAAGFGVTTDDLQNIPTIQCYYTPDKPASARERMSDLLHLSGCYMWLDYTGDVIISQLKVPSSPDITFGSESVLDISAKDSSHINFVEVYASGEEPPKKSIWLSQNYNYILYGNQYITSGNKSSLKTYNAALFEGASYYPAKAKIVYYPFIEPGDLIGINFSYTFDEGNSHGSGSISAELYVTSILWDGGGTMEIETAGRAE